MKEKLNRFFNKIDQEYFTCKNHLLSCQNIRQVQNTNNWINSINNKWDNEIDMLTRDMCTSNRLSYLVHYSDITKNMAEEWRGINEFKVQELTPQNQEPQYPTPIVVKGFC